MCSSDLTGIKELDERLGGGLLPGTLTVVLGATGIGKTQLGTHFCQHDPEDPGILFDMSARGDGQNHFGYCERMFQKKLTPVDSNHHFAVDQVVDTSVEIGDYLHVFEMTGQRVTKKDMEMEQWRDWQAELNRKLHTSIGYLYSNMVRGRKKIVVDGIEPADVSAESIQLNLFEYVYHQIIRKEPEWVARDLFRQDFFRLVAFAQSLLPRSLSPGRFRLGLFRPVVFVRVILFFFWPPPHPILCSPTPQSLQEPYTKYML